ncbi:MAG: homoserine dehydrogenase [Promethearchaeota archaeon]
MSPSNVRVALIGMGTVGREFVRLLRDERDEVEQHGVGFDLVAVYELGGALYDDGSALDLDGVLGAASGTDGLASLPWWRAGLTALDHLRSVDCQLVVEATPTNPHTGEPALSHVKRALERGLSVVTSNKGPFYLEYGELLALSQERGGLLGFESTVGSAMPLVQAREALAGNQVLSIEAILNGTSNFILSRMASEGIPFHLALKEAQEQGYAEADPSLDVDGYDAAGKLVILVNVLTRARKTIKDVRVRGIRSVTQEAMTLAKEEGYSIKPLAVARGGKLEVGPRLVPKGSALDVDGTLNVVKLTTKLAGDLVYVGRGAGGTEAAAGMLADAIRVAKQLVGGRRE